MKSRATRRVAAWSRVALGAALAALIATADAKSLYLIANINASPTPIRTYDIQSAPSYLAFQAAQTIPARAGGAVGLAIDTENRKLFTTYEGSNVIQLVDATNFANLGTTTAPGAYDLAGVVIDQAKRKLYTVDRGTNHLYVYSWDSATNTLTLDGGSYVALAGVSSAHGLALDESRSRLYVGDNLSTTVRYYNTNGWGIDGSFQITATTQTPMGIAVDSRRNVVYMGNAYGGYGSRGELVRHDMTSGAEAVYTLPGAATGDNVLGVAVDEDTGNVYVTTGNQGSGGSDTVLAFDAGLNLLKSDLGDLGNPTGIAIPRASISYNPLNFTKTASPSPVASGSNVSYQLCYDNQANEVGATNVSITDTLPGGTSFVSATGNYEVGGGQVAWSIGPVAAGAAQVCHSLVLRVDAAAGSQLYNSATISGTIGGATVPTTQTLTTNVIGGYKPLAMTMTDSADPVASGTNLTYTTCVNPGSNTLTVNNVRIANPLPAGTSFVSATGGGSFDGSAVNWNLGNLAPETADVCVSMELAVSAAPGAQVSNVANVSSDNTGAQQVSHATDVISNYKPLNLSLDDNLSSVPAGSDLTLNVCYDNSANTLPVTGVTIKGAMPDGTTYVSHTGPATFDGTYITWAIGDVAAGAAQACHTLVVRVTGVEGESVSGAMLIDSNEAHPSSSVFHSTAIVSGAAEVVVDGEGDGGGGSAGLIELLLAAGGVAGAALRRRRAAAARTAAALAVA
ncbi:MAG: hypothetical protein AB1430_17070, partial [Pseudomonadota bacterium]